MLLVEFIESDKSVDDKNDFILGCVETYIREGIEPLQWLEGIVGKLKTALI